ncbi:conserved hypothetical protein [Nitrosotalea sinensis]|jgi:hypothetical protein|uniref:Uncharacterized protein n=1 Tax=Nitrosotalea sinensis TaxID=1499975 RepID=A0A2H1EGB2_9ARCH|nr:hypothetical protein [Candidatus Nitrosotalea sinensis]SHO44760.1 conserved hypothetical protein [Candidatus Nitrosotalea sinensis]
MSNTAEMIYDGFLSNVEKALGKIDVELGLQIMLYERKMPDAYPMVELEIHYKNGVDISDKVSYIRNRYGFLVAAHDDNEVLARGTMNITMLQEIAQDPQVEKLTGSASVASY